MKKTALYLLAAAALLIVATTIKAQSPADTAAASLALVQAARDRTPAEPVKAPPVKDPDAAYYDYPIFRDMIAKPYPAHGGYMRGYLTIGPVDLHAGIDLHSRVDSGAFGPGFPDGVYECYTQSFGKPVMRPVKVPQQMAAPAKQWVKQCVGGVCRMVEVDAPAR